MYRLNNILALKNPERAKKIALRRRRRWNAIPVIRRIPSLFRRSYPSLEREVFGIRFPNPIGLAAGFDTDGECVPGLSALGFGFVEIGSLTAKPEQGNERPRVVAIKKEQALLHRRGTANSGVMAAIANLQQGIPDGCIVSANIARSPSCTKESQTISEFQKAFSLLYDFVSLFTINLSNSDKNGVLAIQDATSVADIVDPLLELRLCYDHYKPILLKVSPDIPEEELASVLDYCQISGVDGIIVGGSSRELTTLAEEKMKRLGKSTLSGGPLFGRTLEMVDFVSSYTHGRFPIVACGGISTPLQAAKVLHAGASLIQVHTAFAYQGPRFIRKTLKYLDEQCSGMKK